MGTIMMRNFKMRIAYDPRGKISTGKSGPEGQPVKLDHFDVTDFPELVKMYGDKPTMLIVMLPTDQPTDFITYRFDKWAKTKDGKSVMVRFCDGDVCVHRIVETLAGRTYEAGEESECVCAELEEDDKQRCRHHFTMKAWVCDPETFAIKSTLCYLFDNHSVNSAEQILSEVKKIQMLTGGRIAMIPFELSVKMVSGTDEAKKTFPIWSLRSVYMLDRVRALTAPKEVKDATEVPAIAAAPAESAAEPAETNEQISARLVAQVRAAKTLEDLRAFKQKLTAAKDRLSRDQFDQLDQMGAIALSEIPRIPSQ